MRALIGLVWFGMYVGRPHNTATNGMWVMDRGVLHLGTAFTCTVYVYIGICGVGMRYMRYLISAGVSGLWDGGCLWDRISSLLCRHLGVVMGGGETCGPPVYEKNVGSWVVGFCITSYMLLIFIFCRSIYLLGWIYPSVL